MTDPTPDAATIEQAAREMLGEALFALSARLKDSGFLADDENHRAYEAVVRAFTGLSK